MSQSFFSFLIEFLWDFIVFVDKNIYLCACKIKYNFFNFLTMKKIYYFIVLLVCTAMMFVACDNTNKPKTEDATQLADLVEAYYSSEFVSGVSNDYWCSFITEDVVIDEEGNPLGTGEFIYLEVFPATVANNFPAGEYAFAEDATDGYAWAGWEWDLGAEIGYGEGVILIPQGSFAYVIEDDELVTTKYMLSGSVKISGTPEAAEVFVDAVFNDGTKSTYYYKGKLKFEDYDNDGEDEELSWDYEPVESGEYTATFDYCEMNNWGDYYGYGTDCVDMVLSGSEWNGTFILSAPLGSGSDVYGTYTVASGYEEWTVDPSPGGSYSYDYASFLGTGFEGDAYTIAYYIASGEVVVAKDGIQFDVVSHYGSKIKGEYKGEVVVVDKSAGYASAQSRANQSRRVMKLVKASAEDMAYMGVLRNRVRR